MTKSIVLKCEAPSQAPCLTVDEDDLAHPVGTQVLVDVEATSVNPIDVKRAGGYGQRLLSLKRAGRFPLVLGNDFAGVVRAVGDKASPWEPGQRVYGVLPPGPRGAHAATVLADARWLRAAPTSVSAQQLAALPYSFTTMWQALRAAGLSAENARDRRVLVHGASGGLGQLALQVLRSWGAKVTAVCSTAHADHCIALGAAEVLDRSQQPLTALEPRFDATLNFASWPDDEFLRSRLKSGALGHATTVHPLLEHVDRLGWLRGLHAAWSDLRRARAQLRQQSPGARYQWVIFKPDATALESLDAFVRTGALTLPTGLAVPFARAHEAFEHVRAGRFGRALLLPRA